MKKQHPNLHAQRNGGVLRLTLDNPEKRNALTPDLLTQLLARLEESESDRELRVVVLSGAGQEAFCSGYDITKLPDDSGAATVDPSLFDRAMERLAAFPLPTIAMLNGVAFGGGFEMALACDLRVGRPGLKMAMPPARLGIAYSENGLQRFINAIGVAHTRRLFYTAQPIDSETAQRWGVLDDVVEALALEEHVMGLAHEIAKGAPLSLRATKRVTNLLSSPRLSDEERSEVLRLRLGAFMSRDFKEGRAAFLEKRTPRFTGE